MNTELSKLSATELRTLFLRQTKKFLKTLDYESPEISRELKDEMLLEIRENLREITLLITMKESPGASSTRISKQVDGYHG